DHEEGDGRNVLDFFQACDQARSLARGSDGGTDSDRPLTWSEGIDAYASDLRARNGRVTNATSLRSLVTPALLSKPIGLLTSNELRSWRDSWPDGGSRPSSVSRYCKSACACLSAAAKRDPRIQNQNAWKIGLETLPGSRRSRNQVLSDDMVRAVVAACYAHDADLGLFVEVLAQSGARPVQVSRLVVGDVQADRLIMPRSAEGSGVKHIDRRPVPVSLELIEKLRKVADKRPADAPLLPQFDLGRLFDRALAAAKLPRCTPYAMRHSSITRQLLRGVPIRVVADVHDTSTQEIEATYAAYISDHSETIVRDALIDLNVPTPPQPDNVVHLPRQR